MCSTMRKKEGSILTRLSGMDTDFDPTHLRTLIGQPCEERGREREIDR